MSRARRLPGILALMVSLMLLGGCGATSAYPGEYGANVGSASVPTSGRFLGGATGPAVLGGTDAAFLATLGQPVDQFGTAVDPALPARLLTFFYYPLSAVDGVVAVRDTGDQAHEHQIMLILLSAPPDQPWTREEANRYSIAYAPADAQLQGTAPVANTRGLAGSDTIYFSTTLAKEFPASAFTDEQGKPVRPGTFNIQYIYPTTSQTNHILSCQLALGTRQTVDI